MYVFCIGLPPPQFTLFVLSYVLTVPLRGASKEGVATLPQFEILKININFIDRMIKHLH
jgi:hypothetical protein